MQGLLYITFLISTVLGTVCGLGDSTCKDIRVWKNFDEPKIAGPWIKWGGNTPSRTCVTYQVTPIRPGRFSVTNKNYTATAPGVQGEITMTANKKSTAVYSMGGGTVYMISGNYYSYVVGYIQPGNFGLYIRGLDVSNDPCTTAKLLKALQKESKICGTKYFVYNLKRDCRHMPKV